MPVELSADEIAARLAFLGSASALDTPLPSFRYIKPFSSTYESVVEAIGGNDDRFRLGLAAVDLLTRGFGPKELIYFTGFSASGKTQLVLTAVLHNSDKRVLFFSMDDPAEMVLMKLACMAEGVSAEVMERKVREHDEQAKLALKTASERFPNLVVVDESLSMGEISTAVEEATLSWGAPPELVVIDYLELIRGTDYHDAVNNVKAQSRELKKWVKDKPFPTLVLHQGTRSNARPGAPITILSMAHGGEQEATILVGVRRKRDWEELDEWERSKHRDTITLHVVKNKRPPSKVTPIGGVDLYMSPDTGLVRPLRDGDLMHEPKSKPDVQEVLTTADDAVRVAREKVAVLSGAAA